MMNAHVLLIEDHQDLAETLIDVLESHAFIVDYAQTGKQGLTLALADNFDAIILDVMLPGMDGYTVCQQLRQTYQQDTPILMLTARDTLDDKLQGFASGTDDYLIKPFAMDELLARLDVMTKRRQGQLTQKRLQVGDLQLDPKNLKVWREGQTISLSPICFAILHILMRQYPNVVTRRVIEQDVWGDQVPDSDALRSNIYMLRKLVDKPFSTPLIHTVKHRGYQLVLN